MPQVCADKESPVIPAKVRCLGYLHPRVSRHIPPQTCSCFGTHRCYSLQWCRCEGGVLIPESPTECRMPQSSTPKSSMSCGGYAEIVPGRPMHGRTCTSARTKRPLGCPATSTSKTTNSTSCRLFRTGSKGCRQYWLACATSAVLQSCQAVTSIWPKIIPVVLRILRSTHSPSTAQPE